MPLYNLLHFFAGPNGGRCIPEWRRCGRLHRRHAVLPHRPAVAPHFLPQLDGGVEEPAQPSQDEGPPRHRRLEQVVRLVRPQYLALRRRLGEETLPSVKIRVVNVSPVIRQSV